MFSSPGPRVELLKHFLAKLVPGRQGLDGPSVLGEILQLKDASFGGHHQCPTIPIFPKILILMIESF